MPDDTDIFKTWVQFGRTLPRTRLGFYHSIHGCLLHIFHYISSVSIENYFKTSLCLQVCHLGLIVAIDMYT